MILRRVIALFVTMVMVGGCATMRDSLIVGVGSGLASGAAVGSAALPDNRESGAITGALVGAAIGGIAAYSIHKGLENRDSKTRKDTLFGLEKFGVSDIPSQNTSVPAISFKVVEEQKIETHRKGNKVVEGHRIWILSDDTNVNYKDGSEKQKK